MSEFAHTEMSNDRPHARQRWRHYAQIFIDIPKSSKTTWNFHFAGPSSAVPSSMLDWTVLSTWLHSRSSQNRTVSNRWLHAARRTFCGNASRSGGADDVGVGGGGGSGTARTSQTWKATTTRTTCTCPLASAQHEIRSASDLRRLGVKRVRGRVALL